MKSIELFAGIGGIALAAEWAGIETVAFCERNPFCQKVLNKHWPDVPIFDDVKTLNKQVLVERGIDVGKIGLISGGFPCQPWSEAAGDKARGKADERHLWPEMFRLIHEIRPTWVVGENVANFARMGLDDSLVDLESIGYKVQSFVIPACAVKAPHERKRTFIVAYSDSERNDSKKEFRIDGDWTEKMQEWEHSQHKPTDKIKTIVSRSRWGNEPGVGRMVDGIPNRVDRCKSLGNAVVPQQIYPIFKHIMEIEQNKP
jgi:DNA (cytosine-5)-methyltransferase 1